MKELSSLLKSTSPEIKEGLNYLATFLKIETGLDITKFNKEKF